MADAVSRPEKIRLAGLGLTTSDVLIGLALAITLLVGGYFRFVGQNWDDFVRFHPDERFLSGVVASLNGPLVTSNDYPQAMYQRCLERYPESGGRGGYFDAECSAMNPNNLGHGLYVYGTLPAFLVRWMADVAVQTTGDPVWGGYNGVHLIGRTLSALAEMGVILTVFFIGVQLHGRWVGLLAAVLYTCTVFSIQQAHFWTTDATSNFFVTLAILFVIRVSDRGALADYLLFGLAAGAALASRINTAPVVGLLLLAVLVQALPALDVHLSWGERGRIARRAAIGLVAAGALTFITFRIFNPYAFVGPGFFGIINIEAIQNRETVKSPLEYIFNPRWLQDMGEAQHLVSGNAESPPNWQWTGRTRYVFAWSNMTLWGMGLALGLTGWLAWVWSGWRLIRGRANALRNLIPVVWVLIYFALLGGQWVMSMRYYLPLYPMLALLAAWALIEIMTRADRARGLWRRWAARGLLVAVVGFTGLWALMFTHIYRHLFAPAAASHWIWENVPGDFAMRVEGADAPLINIAVINPPGGEGTPLEMQASRYETGQPFTTTFTAPADGTITTIHTPHLGQLYDSGEAVSLRFKITPVGGGLVVLSSAELNAPLPRDSHVLGGAFDIPLEIPLEVRAGQQYNFTVEVVSGGPVISAGAVFAWEGDWDEVVPPKVCAFPEGITLADDPPPGLAYNARDCNGRDLWTSLINGYKLQVYWEEEAYKRDRFQSVLDDTEYLIIGTNRRYDSQGRIPYRWPMTMRYYDALFSGELGFELVETFHRTFEFGPLRVSDQHLPTYDSPVWLNEFEAEEAFHVYDHPAVFIFRKTDVYSSENTARILNSVPLNRPDATFGSFNDATLIGVVPLYSLPASAAPTFLKFTPERREIQYSGGTWSERFDSASAVNTQPALTVLVWWLTIVVFGWAAWPLLFVLFPGLVDRGYGVAKITGLLLVGWLTWFAASANIPLWSRDGVTLALLLLVAVSVVLAYRQRAELMAYIRAYGTRLLWIEAITLLAFVFFLLIRLTNPDLWHPSFGGEKPMDFAYMNGVLRSTIFPPIDPWHAGGYINYYYWGYVLVGSPVLLLGLVPSIAYNLIIPTLFALTGIGAFCVAFNVVGQRNEVAHRLHPANPDTETQDSAVSASASQPEWRWGNPWLAGMAALVLAVVLGNLDTPRVFTAEALTRTGFYQQPTALQNYLLDQYAQAHDGQPPTSDEMVQLTQQALEESESQGRSILRGLERMLRGAPLDIAPNRWYWAPTRILSEAPVSSGGAIAEMPFFTFLYGDLHAHMIAMPLLFFAMAFVLNEVLLAGADRRSNWAAWVALALGAGAVGLLRATNTWDWITFMLLGIAGLGFAWWLRWRRLSRAALVHLALRIGGFAAFSALLILPYTTWYAATYSSARAWDGPRSPLWTYLTIHGLFLFLIICLLLWDTVRWLNSVYVWSLRGKGPLVVGLGVIVLALLAVSVVLGLAGYPVTIIAMPLLVWVALLFFRQGQTREMQYVLALAGLALGLTLGVEYVVLEGDVGRQNTVFKFYIQAWLLFSAVGGVAVAWLMKAAPRWPTLSRALWFGVGGLLVTVAALYPVMAARGRALDRMADVPLTLDGAEYMQYASLFEGDPAVLQANPNAAPFSLADDYAMIRWLQENVQGSPIIIEGRADREYRWESRVAIYTGLPSVQGWNWHQRQQRTFDPMPRLVQQRVANVNAFYSTTDIGIAWDILRHYDVTYVIVSSLERAYYMPQALAKFDEMVELELLNVAYRQGPAVVYQVNPDATYQKQEQIPGGI